jgi:peptidoglycan/xylan/chitin deacetylase (PgdA/CDA1 family)
MKFTRNHFSAFVAGLIVVLTGLALVSTDSAPVLETAGTLVESTSLELAATEALTLAPASEDTATPLPEVTMLPSATKTSTRTPTSTPTPTIARTRTPTATATPPARVSRVPILMYHYISVPPPDADRVRKDLSVTPDAFAAQMDYLTTNGYHPVRLVDLADFMLNGTPLPDKPIVLTFDDGYTDNYQNAFPVLKRFKIPATFFVIADFVEEKRWGYMSWAQLDEMAKAGMEIGSHTLDHLDLRSKSRTFQTNEIIGSMNLIEKRITSAVLSFSYPAGRYDANTIAVLRSSGYLSAVTEIQGTRQSSNAIFELRRIRIRGTYTIADYDHWIKYFMSASSK